MTSSRQFASPATKRRASALMPLRSAKRSASLSYLRRSPVTRTHSRARGCRTQQGSYCSANKGCSSSACAALWYRTLRARPFHTTTFGRSDARQRASRRCTRWACSLSCLRATSYAPLHPTSWPRCASACTSNCRKCWAMASGARPCSPRCSLTRSTRLRSTTQLSSAFST